MVYIILIVCMCACPIPIKILTVLFGLLKAQSPDRYGVWFDFFTFVCACIQIHMYANILILFLQILFFLWFKRHKYLFAITEMLSLPSRKIKSFT